MMDQNAAKTDYNFKKYGDTKETYKINNTKKADEENQESLTKLIIWNITKAMDKNPNIDIKSAIMRAQARLESESCNIGGIITAHEEERHVACALLAWQQLGHSNADSLCQFVETHKGTQDKMSGSTSQELRLISEVSSGLSKDGNTSTVLNSFSYGPVVRLPIEQKIVMRLDNNNCCSTHSGKGKSRGKEKEILNKIEAACCLDAACLERLTAIDATTKELRNRAATLARRETERVHLLERAEAAWRDLEIGYQRRLMLAEEKEEDITKQMKKAIEDRNGYKSACQTLVSQLKVKGEAAEKDRLSLNEVERKLYDRACTRMKLSGEVARIDSSLTDQLCKVAQLDRDLKFKEEQARRKLLNFESELDAAQALTIEAERAIRAELNGLRDQITEVSNQLLEEDAKNVTLKKELNELRQEKKDLVDDLEGCKNLCDGRMENTKNELQKKKEKLAQMKDKVFECKCKAPVDAGVEVKRTPSLAALCKCSPEDKLLESCSCTSLRGRLFSTLLSDLFSGLQNELGDVCVDMPCQYLKCLEDRHNWDRASVVKTNLKNYFSKLLVGELDIAIANSIEKYHAKWVGETCADVMKAGSKTPDNQAWQERAIERRAQALATKLAEQLFQEKADQLTQKAKSIMKSGPPPCECKPGKQNTAVYPCLVQTMPMASQSTRSKSPVIWRKALEDVSQLREQLEDLKKDSIKKDDLKLMENKLTKIVQRIMVKEHNNQENNTLDNSAHENYSSKDQKNNTMAYLKQPNTSSKPNTIRKKPSNVGNSNIKKFSMVHHVSNVQKNGLKTKPVKKFGQTYAINTCLCTQNTKYPPTDEVKVPHQQSTELENNDNKLSNDTSFDSNYQEITNKTSKDPADITCPSKSVCFHKVPSNTSIDMLLETLKKWRNDLNLPHKNAVSMDNQQNTSNKTESEVKHIEKLQPQVDLIKQETVTSNILQLTQTLPSNTNYVEEKLLSQNSPNTELNKYDTECNIDLNDSKSKLRVKLVKTGISDKGLDSKQSNLITSNQPNNNENIYDNKDSFNSCKLFAKSAVSDAKSLSNNIELENLPIAKQSEYIGTINLDKSNEELCKCISQKLKSKLSRPLKAAIPSKNTKTAISISSCEQKHRQEKQSKSKIRPSYRKEKRDNQECIIKFMNQDQNKSKEIDEILKDERDDSESKISDCKYNIKFLGVTLNDVNYDKQLDKDNNKKYDQENIESKTCLNTLSNMGSEEVILDNGVKEKQYQNKDTSKTNENFGQSNQNKSLAHNNDMVNGDLSCICCIKQSRDEAKDLEENTFNLLEDYLKQKLENIKKYTLCETSGIPSEEEGKIFSSILNRVKQVISESTNNISCKCNDVGDSQGSWKRAYGLLQEYLKIKIKRVQCSCSSDEENKNVILPGVLDKVSHLIESDFQRLKDLYSNSLQTRENSNMQSQEDETPVKDTSFQSKLSNHSKSHPISHVMPNNISSQVSPYVGMATKACDPIQHPNKHVQVTREVSSDSLNAEQGFGSNNMCIVTELLHTNAESSIPPFLSMKSYNVNKTTSHFTANYLDNFNNAMSIDNVYTKGYENKAKLDLVTEKELDNSNFVTVNRCCAGLICNNCNRLDVKTSVQKFEKVISMNNIDNTKSDINEYFNKGDHFNKIISLKDCSTSYSGEIQNVKENNNGPYMGYTIDCTCDKSIGTCVCPKSTFKPDEKINNIWNEFQSQSCNKKVSYILRSKPKDVNSDNTLSEYRPYLCTHNLVHEADHESKTQERETEVSLLKYTVTQECETDISLCDDTDFIMKYSKDQIDLVKNTMTSTYDDEISLEFASSKNDDALDWSECFSNVTNEVQTKLRNSIYFPIPLEHTDIPKKSDEPSIVTSEKKECCCDMVPICHVKMLVKNIESKLANSACTCDAMVPEVCPVHSPK